MSLHGPGPAKKLEDRVLVFGLKLLILIFKLLPFELACWCSTALAKAAYILLPFERKKALAHLGVAFPHLTWREKKRLAKGCFVSLSRSLVEFIKQDLILRRADEFIEMQGLEELKRAADKGKGVVVVSAHLGNWEMLAATTSRSGLPVTVVAREIEPEQVNRVLLDYRERSGVISVLRDHPEVGREVLNALRAGRVVGILIDQDTKKVKCDFVPFFGHLASTPVGAATLARVSGAPVFLGLSWRVGRKLVFHFEPVDTERFAELEDGEFDRALTAHLTARIEEFVRAHPDQWVWMHERWRHRPAGGRWKPYQELPKLPGVLLIKVLNGIAWLFGKLSLEKAELMGAKLGRLMPRLIPSRKKVALDNITKAFEGIDEKEAERLVVSAFENVGMNLALYLHAIGRTNDVLENVEVEGYERLERLVEEGRGVLAVSAHIGAWELGAWWVAQRLPLSVVVKRIKNRAIEREAERIRGQFGLKTIYDRHTAFQIFKRLANGEVIIMVLDQHAPKRIGVWVDFFGRPASTLKSAAWISAKARVPVIVGYTLRLGAGKYKLVLDDVFEPPELDDDSMKAATQLYTRAIEGAIRTHPEQWFWLHRRWKGKPPSSE